MLHLTADNFEKETATSLPILIDFYADWCGPCQRLAPTIAALDAEAEGYLVAKVNVDEAPALAEAFDVLSIPTLVVLQDGKVKARTVGLQSKQAILSLLA